MQAKTNQLETALTTRDQELATAEVRFKKSIDKAKEIIKSYDPKALPGKTF